MYIKIFHLILAVVVFIAACAVFLSSMFVFKSTLDQHVAAVLVAFGLAATIASLQWRLAAMVKNAMPKRGDDLLLGGIQAAYGAVLLLCSASFTYIFKFYGERPEENINYAFYYSQYALGYMLFVLGAFATAISVLTFSVVLFTFMCEDDLPSLTGKQDLHDQSKDALGQGD